MNRITRLLGLLAPSIFLILSLSLVAAQTAPAPKTAPATSTQSQSLTAPSAQEIADAKAKGMVWVNTSTKVYHKDGQFYGATKHGKFMSEDDATKAGYRAAKTSTGGKKTSTPAASGK